MKEEAKIYAEYCIRNQIAPEGLTIGRSVWGNTSYHCNTWIALAMASWAVLRLWRGVSRSV